MGHEGVGVIDKMHADVADKGFKEGDKVGSLYFIDCCFECEGCQVFNMHCEKGTAKIQGIQVRARVKAHPDQRGMTAG